MKDLMLMLASVMPFDEMIEKLDKDIKAYKAAPTEDGKKSIQINCALILSKEAVDNAGSGLEGVSVMINKMNNMERIGKMFDPDNN